MATAYSDNENGVQDNAEEVLIKYYFYHGYQYKDILDFLATYCNIEISERTLHRRLRRVVYKSREPAKFAGYSAKFCRLLSLLIGC